MRLDDYYRLQGFEARARATVRRFHDLRVDDGRMKRKKGCRQKNST
jgi:hypothetical protein